MKAVWRRHGKTMVPASADAWDELYSVKDNHDCVGEFRGARNPEQLKLFWALIDYLRKNYDGFRFASKQAARRAIFLKLNEIDIYYDLDGRAHFEPKSIAFESMIQADFDDLFKKFLDLAADLLNDSPENIRKGLHDMINPVKGSPYV